tara:strand:- start:229 stop:543 length:315 start_codon:yes stop_codon:yes gene_type:complete
MSRLGVRNGFRRPKSFKDIKWKQHRIGKGSIQGLLMLDNGIEFSVVAGPTMYSLPRDAGNSPDDFDKFEVAIIGPDNHFISSEEGDVLGWQSRSDINKLIQIHA